MHKSRRLRERLITLNVLAKRARKCVDDAQAMMLVRRVCAKRIGTTFGKDIILLNRPI